MSRVLDNHQTTKLRVFTLVVFSAVGRKQNKFDCFLNFYQQVATPWAWTLMGIPEAVAGPGVLKKVNGPGVAVPITSIMFNNIQVSIFDIVRASVKSHLPNGLQTEITLDLTNTV